MSTAETIRLILLALVFLAWVWLMFRTISVVSDRAKSEGSFGSQLGNWFRDPDDRKDRNTLLFLTFVLAAMIFMQVALPAP
jgi:hypothetical protein